MRWLLSNFFRTIPTGYHGKKQKKKFASVFKKNGPMQLIEMPSRTVGEKNKNKKCVRCLQTLIPRLILA
jgi:hypothetical protein